MTEIEKVPVLLVDDRPENLIALEALLEDMGLEIFTAASGNAALQLTLKHDFAIVLMDVRMPDMDGFEVAKLMRANPRTRRLPIIFVTATMKDIEHEFKGYEAGAFDYLLKPIAPTIIRCKIKVFCELYNAMKTIERIARVDALTGAWNRRQFDEVVERELDRSKRYGHPLSLMLFDIDHFKKINDNNGHAEGDRVLRLVADDIRGILRKPDSLTRWGGEEFIVLMPNTGLSNATILAERIRTGLASHAIDGVGPVTVSIGVAEYVPSDSCDQWVARADDAMYKAKHSGRNRVEVDATPAATPRVAEHIEGAFAQLIWKDHFLCGNRLIDSQHQGLFEDANQLLSAILSGRPLDEVSAVINTLYRDMIKHFLDEEAILAAVGYPEIREHAALHRALANSAVTLVERFHAGLLGIGELFQFLAHDVVSKHLLSDDRQYFWALHDTQ